MENQDEEKDALYNIKCLNMKCLFQWKTNKPEMMINNLCPRCQGLNIMKEKIRK